MHAWCVWLHVLTLYTSPYVPLPICFRSSNSFSGSDRLMCGSNLTWELILPTPAYSHKHPDAAWQDRAWLIRGHRMQQHIITVGQNTYIWTTVIIHRYVSAAQHITLRHTSSLLEHSALPSAVLVMLHAKHCTVALLSNHMPQSLRTSSSQSGELVTGYR